MIARLITTKNAIRLKTNMAAKVSEIFSLIFKSNAG